MPLVIALLHSVNNQIAFGEITTKLEPAPNSSFSIVVIPDTQRYQISGKDSAGANPIRLSNPIFESWTDWISNHIIEQRIVFVSHVGDIVDVNNRDQWQVARRCMDKLHGKVPYGISVGNHDMTGEGNSKLFQEYFAKERFESFDWYGGCYEIDGETQAVSVNNANSYQLFEAGGMQFIVLHLECNAPDEVLKWASDVLNQHHDKRAMITTHMGLGPKDRPVKAEEYFTAPKGRMTWTKRHGPRGNSPQQMWEKCFSKHENIFMVCCGDQSRTQAMRQKSIGKNGNTVHEVLSDYGNNGLRLMRFIPSKNQIKVFTYEPLAKELCQTTSIVKERDQHQFTLQYQMSTD